MKKSKIIGLSLLTTLLIFSFANVSRAAPPDYVGVSGGQTYTWVVSANMANVNVTAISILGQDNWTIVYDMLDEMVWNSTHLNIGDFLGTAFRLQVHNVTDEVMVPLPSPHPAFPGAAVFGQISVAFQPGAWGPLNPLSVPAAVVMDPANINSTNFMYFLAGGGSGMVPLIMAKGFPYLTVAPWMNAAFGSLPPLYNNMTLSGLSNGFNMTLLASFLEWGFTQSGIPLPLPTFSDINCIATWNSNGVLDLVSVSYLGLTLISIQLLPADAEIPGFVIPVFVGVSAATILGVVSIIKRKKHIV
jgi:hypothetical protein